MEKIKSTFANFNRTQKIIGLAVVIIVFVPFVVLLLAKPEKRTFSPLLFPSPTSYPLTTQPVVTSLLKENLPTQNPAFSLGQNSNIVYTGPILNNPERLPVGNFGGVVAMTKNQAVAIASRLSFSGSPLESTANGRHQFLDWANQDYSLSIDLNENLITLSSLNPATINSSSFGKTQALEEISKIVSLIENRNIELSDKNTREVKNPDFPNIFTVEIYPLEFGIYVITDSQNNSSIVHFNLSSGNIQSLTYSLNPPIEQTSLGEVILIPFSQVINSERLKNGTILNLYVPGEETYASQSNTYTLTQANFTSAYVAYFVKTNNVGVKTLFPVYIFEGSGQISEISNKTFQIKYLIPAINT